MYFYAAIRRTNFVRDSILTKSRSRDIFCIDSLHLGDFLYIFFQQKQERSNPENKVEFYRLISQKVFLFNPDLIWAHLQKNSHDVVWKVDFVFLLTLFWDLATFTSLNILSGVRKLLLQYYILYSLTAGWNSVEDKLENLGKL